MKTRSNDSSRQLFWRRWLAVAAGASLFACGGCSISGGSSLNAAACCQSNSNATASATTAEKGAAAVPASDRSLYQLDSSWTNDASVALKLSNLGGRPQVVAMFFARCEYACPALVYDMKKVQAALPESLRTRTGFALVTFDSDRDTPAVLATYRQSHELPANWTLLRGSSDDVLELAALLGVKFKQDARGQFAHSNLITVLNGAGEIVHQQVGLNQAPDETVKQLTQLFPP